MLITGEFEKEDQREIQEYSFRVEEDTANFVVSYLVEKEDYYKRYYLRVIDPLGEVRYFKTLCLYPIPEVMPRTEVAFSKEWDQCSHNVKKGDLLTGDWKVQLMADLPQKSAYEIEIKMNVADLESYPDRQYLPELDFSKMLQEGSRWYRGDFHSHTTFSDGNADLYEAASICDEHQLDFIFVTDHHNVTLSYGAAKTVAIAGTELDTTPLLDTDKDTHMNLLGFTDLFDFGFDGPGFTRDHDYYLKLIKKAKEQGALFQINHPFMHPYGSVDFKILPVDMMDTYEVLSDPSYRASQPCGARYNSNESAIRYFDELWKRGYRVTGVGGSDSHNGLNHRYEGASHPSTYGIPATCVYMDGFSVDNLKDAVRKGRTYLTLLPNDQLEISILSDGRQVMPGSEAKGTIQYFASLNGDVMWQLVVNGEIKQIQVGRECNFEFELSENSFARVQARNLDEENTLRVFINPIHNHLQKEEGLLWGEVTADFQYEWEASYDL